MTVTFSRSATHLALRTRALPALPAVRAWENDRFTPTKGVPYVAESFVPATQSLKGLTAHGLIETSGIYVLTWFDLPNLGTVAFNAAIDAVLARFAPNTVVLSATNYRVRIRTDVAPWAGQITNPSDLWAACTITIPWLAETYNT